MINSRQEEFCLQRSGAILSKLPSITCNHWNTWFECAVWRGNYLRYSEKRRHLARGHLLPGNLLASLKRLHRNRKNVGLGMRKVDPWVNRQGHQVVRRSLCWRGLRGNAYLFGGKDGADEDFVVHGSASSALLTGSGGCPKLRLYRMGG